jgi:polyphenol oxidase
MRVQPSDGFAWVQAAPGPALVCRTLEPLAAHLFTTRGWPLGSPEGNTGGSWREVAAAVGVDAPRLARAHQVHGASVVVRRGGATAAGEESPPSNEQLPQADILLTDDPAQAVAIQTADCVPLLIADRRTGAVAAAHAGWRGLAAHVPGVAVEAMAREFGSRPGDLIAAIGPSISAASYEVGPDVRARFDRQFSPDDIARWFAPGRADRWQFDSWRAAQDQLEAAGVPTGQIHVARLCTAVHADLLCSYRRDGARAGRMAAVIRAKR